MPILNSCIDCPSTVTAKSLYFCILFPNGYRYYFNFVEDETSLVIIDHPFDRYFPIGVSATGGVGNGAVLSFESYPNYSPFKDLTVDISLSQTIYSAISTAIGSPQDPTGLVPPVISQTSGVIDFLLMTTDEGSQIKLDIEHPYHEDPVSPVTIDTLQWDEKLFNVSTINPYNFIYTTSGSLAMTFQDPKFCFLRQWIVWPSDWVQAIKSLP